MDEKIVSQRKKTSPMLPMHPFKRGAELNRNPAVLRDVTETEFANTLAWIGEKYCQGMTLKEISDELKLPYTSIVDVYLVELRRQWRLSADTDFAERQALELARLDMLERTYWTGYERSKQLKATQKQIGRYKDNESRIATDYEAMTETQVGDVRFLDGVYKCIDRRLRVFGIDPETKIRMIPPTPEQGHDLDRRLAKYAAQFGVQIIVNAAADRGETLERVDEQRAHESVDTERSASAAERISDVIDAEFRDST